MRSEIPREASKFSKFGFRIVKVLQEATSEAILQEDVEICLKDW